MRRRAEKERGGTPLPPTPPLAGFSGGWRKATLGRLVCEPATGGRDSQAMLCAVGGRGAWPMGGRRVVLLLLWLSLLGMRSGSAIV